MQERCSIIIPHFNQEIELRACLKALDELNYFDNEVILVDNRSDITPSFAEKDYKVKLFITETSGSPYEARNLGLSKANYENIVLLDVNCIVQPGFIENGLKLLDENTILAGVPILNENSLMTSWQLYDFLYSIVREEDMRSQKSLPATTLFFKRESFKRIGPFPTVRSLGDIAWTGKAHSLGYKLKISEESTYIYPFKDKEAFIKKYQRLGGGEVENGKIKNIFFYLLKNIFPPSGKFIRRFLYLNNREKTGLSFMQIFFFCWIVKVLYGIGSYKKYRE